MSGPDPVPAPVLGSDHAVTLIGGGPVSAADLAACLDRAPGLVAADGGADRALALGRRPDAVIGDLDSLGDAARAELRDVLHPVNEQDSTDFEKCLIRTEAPLVLATGFLGARIDHALAVFNTLARHPARRCVIVSETDLAVLAPPRLALDLAEGTRVSLFPMCQVRGRDTGLVWPLEGIGFAPDGTSGTSNRARGPVTLAFDVPGMLLILPRACLDTLLAGLADAPGWP